MADIEEYTDTLVGQGRRAIELIVDADSFRENEIPGWQPEAGYGPGAVVGTATLSGRTVVVLANDAEAINDRFPVVYFGVIGLEEAYKMARTVYAVIEADRDKPQAEKTPLVLIVDTPGNGPGRVEELYGMNCATGAYQLALAEARQAGHPVVAMVVGRAISGAFLCHGLQAGRILALAPEFGTMIHVMPITSISRITKIEPERLHELSQSNPVFAAGVNFFSRLGGVDEVIESFDQMAPAISRHIEELLSGGGAGPQNRGALGAERGGRVSRPQVEQLMADEFAAIAAEIY